MNIKRLNIFATTSQIEYIKHCQSMPMMAMTNPAPPGPGVSPVIPMFTSPIEAAHHAALEQGLPEIPGYYGIDLSNGEFVTCGD
jgi:hypothetical protein